MAEEKDKTTGGAPAPTPTPPPLRTPRGSPSLGQIAAAAFSKREPNRKPYDQYFYWPIKATKELGFPIAVALILLLKMPGWLKDAVASSDAVRQEQTKAVVSAIDRSSAAIDFNTGVLSQLVDQAAQLKSASDTVKGMVLGKLKCPQCPDCKVRCPDPNVRVVAPPVSPYYGQPLPPVEDHTQRQREPDRSRGSRER